MRYTIYKTTNSENGKFYIGKHQTLDPNDAYLGSGIALKRAIKTYGRDCFAKEVLFIYDTEAEMNAKEIELITEQLISDSQCYNMTIGGEGGAHFAGRTHSKESRAKMGRPGRTLTEEQRAKVSEAGRRRVWRKETGEKIAAAKRGKPHSPETRAKIAESLRSRNRK